MENKEYAAFDVLGRITELLKLNRMSVYRLSRQTGIPQSTISSWYKKHYYPPVDKLEIICRVFGISLADFFCRQTETPAVITPEDSMLLRQWHQLPRHQKKLLGDLANELQVGRRGVSGDDSA